MSTSATQTKPAKPVWPLFVCEAVGTALLIAIGGSFVVLDFGPGSPIVHLIPDPAVRRALTGFLFGATGGSIALSRVGKVSGAHINPVVTLAFWMRRNLSHPVALGYVIAQMVGAVIGALCLLAWGPLAADARTAATTPGPQGSVVATLGEIGATFCLIAGLFAFLGHRRLRRYTPFLFAPLYAVLVWLEAPLSGTSTNPARTFGPALVGSLWRGWPVYWVGPILGTGLAIGVLAALSRYTKWEVRVAKMYHFAHDPRHVLHRGWLERARKTPPPGRDGSKASADP